jgi:hypothetical protein
MLHVATKISVSLTVIEDVSLFHWVNKAIIFLKRTTGLLSAGLLSPRSYYLP